MDGYYSFYLGMIQFSLLDYKNNQFNGYVQQVMTTASVPHIQATLSPSFVLQYWFSYINSLFTLMFMYCTLMKIKSQMTSTEAIVYKLLI